MSDLTQILERVESGDAKAADELLPLVYDELRRLAAHKMSLQPPGQTLQATALVHEAYLRLRKFPGNDDVDIADVREFLDRGCVRSTSRSTSERPKVRDSIQRSGGCVAAAAGPVDTAALPWLLRRAAPNTAQPRMNANPHEWKGTFPF